jgi:hypothetical protein
MRPLALLTLMLLILLELALPLRAQTDDDRYTIMRPEKPEPWLAPKYKPPRGTRERAVIPQRAPDQPPRVAAPPPPVYVPETGRLLPNLPTVSPSGPGGRETYQDRAARCAHQAGAYGALAGDRNAYIGSCINQ